jgi:hypothetical protein
MVGCTFGSPFGQKIEGAVLQNQPSMLDCQIYFVPTALNEPQFNIFASFLTACTKKQKKGLSLRSHLHSWDKTRTTRQQSDFCNTQNQSFYAWLNPVN